MTGNPDVIVIGAGVIGLSVAWRCAQRGLVVTVVDPAVDAPDSGRAVGAWHTAAGMLAPVTELHYEGRELLALNVDSAARYPDFAAELAEATGLDVGYRRCGTVQVAWDAADLADLRALHAFQASLGVTSELLTSRDLRKLSPTLAAGLPGGLWAADDHQVDNRLLHAALLVAARRAGVDVRQGHVASVDVRSGRAAGVRIDDGASVSAAHIVLAAGAWSRDIGGLPDDVRPPVRPVKGQTIRLTAPPDLLPHVVRGSVKGHPVYLVPRTNGEVVVGASSEEAGFDIRARTGAVYELLRDATALVPELSEVTFAEVSTSVRPGSPDNAPIIGPTRLDGFVVATGHYRNGILLTPITGDEVATIVADGKVPDVLAAFSPDRFGAPVAATGAASAAAAAATNSSTPIEASPCTSP
ncbi:MAG TPA: glycine oxidase ThiO [Micromonosporaceae bacterium]|nr:glycine oxidase ThiO [Micromonosporaceae bacterium]